jgi:hypothetical protein
MQQTLMIILLVALALGTLGVLVRGIVIMARGKDVTGVQSNKMMSYRVALQFAAIVVAAAILLINRH